MTTAHAEPGPTAPARPPDELLSAAVVRTVSALQHQYREEVPAATAALARLRRALTAIPGDVPDVWAHTIGALPQTLLGRGDEPSTFELAAHEAVTLYALHQQGERQRDMHVPGRRLGGAVAALRDATQAGRDTPLDAVTRRFLVLGTATAPAEALHHLRQLVGQLRGQHIPLDYGRLAVDLRRLRSPRLAPGVRLQWGRDLVRAKSVPDPQPTGEQ